MKKTGALVGARGLAMLCQAVLFGLLARQLSGEVMGRWLAALAVVQVVSSILDFGTTISAQRLLADSDRHSRMDALTGLRLLALASLPVGTLIFVLAASLGMSAHDLVVLYPMFFFARVLAPFTADASASGRFAALAAADLAFRVAPPVLVALRLAEPRSGAAIGSIIGGIAAVAFLRRRSGPRLARSFRWTPARTVLKNGGRFGLISTSSLLHGRNDQLILAASGYSSGLPSYAAAYRLFDATVALASGALATVLGDLHRLSDPAAWVRRAVRTYAFLGVGLTAALAAVSPLVPLVLLGRHDHAAVICALILAPSAGFGLVNGLLARIALFVRADTALLHLAGCLMISNLTLNALLLPVWGIRGAAATTTLFEALTVAATGSIVYRSLRRGALEPVESAFDITSAVTSGEPAVASPDRPMTNAAVGSTSA
jgi:O-antigen/teichoic acid export membrane protein